MSLFLPQRTFAHYCLMVKGLAEDSQFPEHSRLALAILLFINLLAIESKYFLKQ